MASDLECFLDWFKEIKVISSDDKDLYLKNHGAFVKQLCNGYILAQIVYKINKRLTFKMSHKSRSFSNYLDSPPLIEQRENFELFFTTCEKYEVGNLLDDDVVHPCNPDDVRKLMKMIIQLSSAAPIGTSRPTNVPELSYNIPQLSNVPDEDYILSLANEDPEDALKDNHEVPVALSGVFQEIATVSREYSKVLKAFRRHCISLLSESASLFILHVQNLRLDPVIDLQERFLNDLLEHHSKTLDGTRPNILDTIVKFKDDFLIYSDIMDQCRFLLCNSSRDDLNLKIFLALKTESEEEETRFETTFDRLLRLPFKYLCDQRNLMERVMKEARKEIARNGLSQALDELLESTRIAHQTIHEVLLFTQAFMADDSESVRRTASKISCDSTLITSSIDKEYGKLLYEFCARCKTTKAAKHETCLCLCFHCGIFIFLNQQSILGFARQDLEFVAFLSISPEADVTIETPSNHTITLKISNSHNSEEVCSLEIHAKESHAKTICMRLKKCYDKEQCKPLKSSHHWKHAFGWLNYKPIAPGHKPLICHLCGIYLFGELSPGIHCQTCNQDFHSDCFLTGRTDINFYADSNHVDPPEHDLKSMMGTEIDKKKLPEKELGTFLVYEKKNVKCPVENQTEYRIAVLVPAEKSKKLAIHIHRITSYKINDTHEAFYLEKQSRGFQSIPQLVKHYKKRFNLLKPFHCVSIEQYDSNSLYESEEDSLLTTLQFRKIRFTEMVLFMTGQLDKSFIVIKESNQLNPYTIFVNLQGSTEELAIQFINNKYQILWDENCFDDLDSLLTHYNKYFVHRVENINYQY